MITILKEVSMQSVHMQTQENNSYDEVYDNDDDDNNFKGSLYVICPYVWNLYDNDDDDNNVKGSLYVIFPYADTRGPMPRRGYWTCLAVASLDFFGLAMLSSSPHSSCKYVGSFLE